jgi:hypothetical protein
LGACTPENTDGGAGGTGGNPSSGGVAAVGGIPSSGGASATGGNPASGGTATGGASTKETLAFPGAEGFARLTPGGRRGAVCHVTNLGDSGTGSLRDCVTKSNVTVVFDVGGWINLASGLGVTGNNVTVSSTRPRPIPAWWRSPPLC